MSENPTLEEIAEVTNGNVERYRRAVTALMRGEKMSESDTGGDYRRYAGYPQVYNTSHPVNCQCYGCRTKRMLDTDNDA